MISSISGRPRVQTRPHPRIPRRVSLRPATTSKTIAIDGRRLGDWLIEFLETLPDLPGNPISIELSPCLTAHRGKLLSEVNRGRAVHAASFLPQRRIVLETQLAQRSQDLRLVLTHEIFHFVWWRLGNQARSEYDALIRNEVKSVARGELGESSAVAKESLRGCSPAWRYNSWRGYLSESFCDTAGWVYSGVGTHSWFQLAARWRTIRASWFAAQSRFRV